MEKLTLDRLEAHLWQSANILRGSIDSSDYKSYIFGLLFLKRLSDVFEEEAEKILEETANEYLAWEDPDEHYFYVPERARWKNLQTISQNIGAAINKAFEALEDQNPTLERVLVSIDFNDKERLTDAVLQRLMTHFSQISFRNDAMEDPDILGRAYEYLIRQFADDAGKKDGEFYTPRQVVRLIIELVDPRLGMRVYDPCCGSAGMLIYTALHVNEKKGGTLNLSLYGQEKNLNTWAIAKMNVLLLNQDADIRRGDTMLHPLFLRDGQLELFDRVVANPMWNQKEWGKDQLDQGDSHGRFVYGLPPKNSADWAWIQHMLASLNSDGKMGVVLDNGVLFRGASEGKIRKQAIQNDLVEAVIALPANLFYNTSSPGCILVLNKNKSEERQGKIILIYGEEDYREGSNQNFLRDEDVEKIVTAYDQFGDQERYCRVVDLEEIERNDYNLNVPRYVDTTEPEEPIDIPEVLSKLKRIEAERDEIEETLNGYLVELGYDE